MNSEQFKSWLSTTSAGTKMVYFTGLLMRDRKLGGLTRTKEIDQLANTVWYAAGMRFIRHAHPTAKTDCTDQWMPTGERRITLTQRKLSDPLGYEYIATKV